MHGEILPIDLAFHDVSACLTGLKPNCVQDLIATLICLMNLLWRVVVFNRGQMLYLHIYLCLLLSI